MEEFYRIRRLPPYVFEQVNRAKAAARNAGADIIDLGMGNPDLPTPKHIVEKLAETARRDGHSGGRYNKPQRSNNRRSRAATPHCRPFPFHESQLVGLPQPS